MKQHPYWTEIENHDKALKCIAGSFLGRCPAFPVPYIVNIENAGYRLYWLGSILLISGINTKFWAVPSDLQDYIWTFAVKDFNKRNSW